VYFEFYPDIITVVGKDRSNLTIGSYWGYAGDEDGGRLWRTKTEIGLYVKKVNEGWLRTRKRTRKKQNSSEFGTKYNMKMSIQLGN